MANVQVYLPAIIPDNDEYYFEWLLTTLEYSCPDSDVVISETEKGYNIHITPANEELRQSIIDNVLEIHRRFGIKITYSKSLKISKKVSFFVRKIVKKKK